MSRRATEAPEQSTGDALTISDVKMTNGSNAESAIIASDERVFALRLWRHFHRKRAEAQRWIDELAERYGFTNG